MRRREAAAWLFEDIGFLHCAHQARAATASDSRVESPHVPPRWDCRPARRRIAAMRFVDRILRGAGFLERRAAMRCLATAPCSVWRWWARDARPSPWRAAGLAQSACLGQAGCTIGRNAGAHAGGRTCAQQKGRRMRRRPSCWRVRPAQAPVHMLSRRCADRGCRRRGDRRPPDARRRGDCRPGARPGLRGRASVRRRAGRPDAPRAAPRRRG
jgi:hypothetical protein